MKIVLWALVLALTWTFALIIIARPSTFPALNEGRPCAVGLPGVVIANWTQAQLFHRFHRSLGFSLMFLINWGFYCSVLQGIISLKRRISNE